MKLCLKCKSLFEKEDWVCPFCGDKPLEQNGWLLFSPELSKSSDGFKASYFDDLIKVEEKSFWFCARNRLISWALRKYFPSARNFFEIGCGTGFVLSGVRKAFPELDLYGSEVFSSGLEFARRRVSKANLMQMDACRIPFKEEFDVIGAFDILEHIKEDETVLAEMYKAARPGGGIILTVPQHPFLWSKVDEYSCHVRRYALKELESKVRASGFKILRKTSFVSLLLPLLILSRMRWKKSTCDYDSMSEYKIGSLANSVLERVLDFEKALIQVGFNFPVGGSLILVAMKDSS